MERRPILNRAFEYARTPAQPDEQPDTEFIETFLAHLFENYELGNEPEQFKDAIRMGLTIGWVLANRERDNAGVD